MAQVGFFFPYSQLPTSKIAFLGLWGYWVKSSGFCVLRFRGCGLLDLGSRRRVALKGSGWGIRPKVQVLGFRSLGFRGGQHLASLGRGGLGFGLAVSGYGRRVLA